MLIDRDDVSRYLAIAGFTLSFLFVIAIVALAFGVVSGMNDLPPSEQHAAGKH
jgi:hypothetical protein